MNDKELHNLLAQRKFEASSPELGSKILAASKQAAEAKPSNFNFFFVKRAIAASFLIAFLGIALSFNLPSELSGSNEAQSLEEFLLVEDFLN